MIIYLSNECFSHRWASTAFLHIILAPAFPSSWLFHHLIGLVFVFQWFPISRFSSASNRIGSSTVIFNTVHSSPIQSFLTLSLAILLSIHSPLQECSRHLEKKIAPIKKTHMESGFHCPLTYRTHFCCNTPFNLYCVYIFIWFWK